MAVMASKKLAVAISLMLVSGWAMACSDWAAGQGYAAGTYVKYGGKVWKNKWWSQNEAPGASQWGPWEERPASECTGTPGPNPNPPGGPVIPPEPKPTVGKHVGSYFTQWGIYGRNYKLRDLVNSGGDSKLTFLNYAFGNVYADGKCGIVTRAESGNGDGGDGFADYQKSFSAADSVDGVADQWSNKLRGNFNQLRKLKLKKPDLKVLISLGGWTWSKNFSKAASTEAGRQQLVNSCIDIYIKGNLPVGEDAGGQAAARGVFDGIDIDWEYPVAGGLPTNQYSPADKQNFTLLMAEFRKQLDAQGLSDKRRYYLTAAVGAGVDKIRNTEPVSYGKYMDWVNVMTYDFFGGWEAKGPTNFQSALYRDPAAPVKNDLVYYNGNDAVQALINAGLPKEKVVLGIPFYGRGWKGVAAGPNGDGLYQSANGPAAATYEAGIEDYKVLKNKRTTLRHHPITKQLWAYDGNEFWSYDDPTVIRTKIQYVNQQGLGGLFSWSLDGDDSAATLLKTTAEIRGTAPAPTVKKR